MEDLGLKSNLLTPNARLILLNCTLIKARIQLPSLWNTHDVLAHRGGGENFGRVRGVIYEG